MKNLRFRCVVVSLSSMVAGASALFAAACSDMGERGDSVSEGPKSTQAAATPVTEEFGTFTAMNPVTQPWPGHMLPMHASLIRDPFNQNNAKILGVAGSSYNSCNQDLTPTNPVDIPGDQNDGTTSDSGVIKEEARLFDVATGTWSNKLTSPAPYGTTFDAFCSGQAHDAEGGVIFQGGILNHGAWNLIGIRKSARYEFWNGVFANRGYTGTAQNPVVGTEGDSNNYMDDNYYPTVIAGPLDTFVFPGGDGLIVSSDNNNPRKNTNGERGPNDNFIHRLRYAYGSSVITNWKSLGTKYETKQTYPRVHLLPDGRFFVSSPETVSGNSGYFNPVSSVKTMISTATPPESFLVGYSYHLSRVLAPLTPAANGTYPNPQVISFGFKDSIKIDLGAASPAWGPTAARSPAVAQKDRFGAVGTLLPTGQILFDTGSSNGQLVNEPTDGMRMVEVYDPEQDLWMDMTSNLNPVVRSYHSVNLLLPNGSVWSAGGNINAQPSDQDIFFQTNGKPTFGTLCDGTGNWAPDRPTAVGDMVHASWEIFNPWYTTAARPVITSSSDNIVSDGSTITIQVANSEGTAITRVALMRAGTVTHAFDVDQRLIWLPIIPSRTTSSQVVVRAPYGAAAAPPGDYLLFVLKNGPQPTGIKRFIPSTGRWVRVANQSIAYGVTPANYDAVISFAAFSGSGQRPGTVDAYEEAGAIKFNIAFTRDDGAQWFTRADMTAADLQNELTNLHPAPYRLVHLDSYQYSATDVRYVGVWNTSPAPGGGSAQWVDQTEANHNSLVTWYKNFGYRIVAQSTVMVSGTAKYSAVVDSAAVGAWEEFHAKTQAEVTSLVTSQAPKRLAFISAYMDGTTPKFNVVFSSFDAGVNPNARNTSNALLKEHELGMVGVTGLQTAQELRIQQGYSARSFAGYQVSGALRFSGVWSLRPTQP